MRKAKKIIFWYHFTSYFTGHFGFPFSHVKNLDQKKKTFGEKQTS